MRTAYPLRNVLEPAGISTLLWRDSRPFPWKRLMGHDA